MTRFSRIVSTLLLGSGAVFGSLANASSGSTGSDNFSSGCATLEFMAKMIAVNILLPAPHDDRGRLLAMQDELKTMNRQICQQVILTEDTRFSASYPNGNLVSRDLYHDAWYFPNGGLFMTQTGRDVTVHYPDGTPMAYHWTHSGEAVFWPNGRLATNRFREHDVTWHYPDGQIITYRAGLQGERWFYPFPRLDGRIGQELISDYWGVEDEDFSFINFTASGSLYLTRERMRRKLVLTDFDLLDVPGVMLLITRLYQADDEARLFVPADANITGAPY